MIVKPMNCPFSSVQECSIEPRGQNPKGGVGSQGGGVAYCREEVQ